MPNYQNRIKRLQKRLEEMKCEALLVENLIDLYYLTGLNLSLGKLFVTPAEAKLVVDGRYIESCKTNSPVPVILLENHVLTDLIKNSGAKAIGFDSVDTSFDQYRKLQESIDDLVDVRMIPVENPVMELRMIKDEEEIEILRRAANLGSEGYDFLCHQIEEDVSEVELAIELEIFWKRKGSKAVAFDPIIAFGSNSSMPHYHVGDTKLKKGQTVLMDIGVNLDYYHSDMTRVVFYGEPDPKMREIYGIVLEAQESALELCRPGTLVGDLDSAARDLITKHGYGEMFSHSLGHGVGLDIHETPTLRNKPPSAELPLKEGMVITIEPGIYLPGLGGVRIEDTVVITADGHENLTNRSKELRIID